MSAKVGLDFVSAVLTHGKTYYLFDPVTEKVAYRFARGKAVRVPVVVAGHLADQTAQREVEIRRGVFELHQVRIFRFDPELPNLPALPEPILNDRRSADDRRRDSEEVEFSD